ncbi:hypothetical protein [Pseudoruegeria sp. HB172150]|uniref:hypothetical protein n=1 Tax=Pseudoruegeria sp. HB172150 TaxID=2721164 RepID=UPI001553D2CF|nr:hypothetical protein [Pseudoruegeria sp. HB172150]
MISHRKSLGIAAILAITSVALTGSASAFTCKNENGDALSFGQKYEDNSLLRDSGASKEFFIVNGEAKIAINEVKLVIHEEDGSVVDSTVGEPDIDSDEDVYAVFNGEAYVFENTDIGARFGLTWDDDYHLYVMVKWRYDVHSKGLNDDLDGDYNPFTFPVEEAGTVNGLIVTRHGSGLGVDPLYDCE